MKLKLCYKCHLPERSWGEGRLIHFNSGQSWHDGCWTKYCHKQRDIKARIKRGRKIYLAIIKPANIFKFI